MASNQSAQPVSEDAESSTPSETTTAVNPIGIGGILSWGRASTIPRPQTPRRNAELVSQSKPLGHVRQTSMSKQTLSSESPQLNVRWFHAVDVPKRMPFALVNDKPKPAVPAKKYQPFSESDSNAIEASYRRMEGSVDSKEPGMVRVTTGQNRSLDAERARKTTKVPVNEDYLFDVDLEYRELAPAYWLGPVYDVCRGSWFYSGMSEASTAEILTLFGRETITAM
jgi:hypothetical protein